jgi:peptide alpha-N-acetyltransferase
MADNEDGDVTSDAPAKRTDAKELSESDLQYVQYEPSKEEQYLPAIRQLISKDLSEPYSIYVYRYFLYQWGDLCYMVPVPSSPLYLSDKLTPTHRPSPPLTL